MRQASDLLGASVGRRGGWEEAGGITDPIQGWSASVIPEEIQSGTLLVKQKNTPDLRTPPGKSKTRQNRSRQPG